MDLKGIQEAFKLFKEMDIDFGELMSVFGSKSPGKILAKIVPPILVRVEPFLKLALQFLSDKYGQKMFLIIREGFYINENNEQVPTSVIVAAYEDAETGYLVPVENKLFIDLVEYIMEQSDLQSKKNAEQALLEPHKQGLLAQQNEQVAGE